MINPLTATKFGEVYLCNGDCNNCRILFDPNSKILTHIFNELYDKLGNEVYKIVQEHCPNLTVCFDCRIDDFCHVEGCEIIHPNEETELERTRGW